MKRLLIITYYWPPLAGSGVQRWLKFAKYLPEYGWEPIIFTPENPSFQLPDMSLLEDVRANQVVWKAPIWEPHHLFYRFKGQKSLAQVNQTDILDKEKNSLVESIGLWVRGNLFIPDPRLFWIRPAVKFLHTQLKEHPVDAIATTGPPHSLHFIGKKLKEKTGIPWLADFRDPWTRWIFLRSFHISKPAMRIHQWQERSILQAADTVVTVSHALKQEFEEISNRSVQVITNGYDEDDFPARNESHPDKFLITYVGTIDYLRDPRVFFAAVKQLCQENSDFSRDVQIHFIGYLSGVIMEEVKQDEFWQDRLTISSYAPHQEILRLLQEAYVLLLLYSTVPEARGILSGKLFEYLASHKRILALGSVGNEIDQVLQRTQAGVLHDPNDLSGIKASLLQYYRAYQSGEDFTTQGVEAYSRRNLTQTLSEILEALHPVSS